MVLMATSRPVATSRAMYTVPDALVQGGNVMDKPYNNNNNSEELFKEFCNRFFFFCFFFFFVPTLEGVV